MAADDLAGFLADDCVEVPIPGGKTYRVPSPDAATGLRLTAMVNLGVQSALGGEITEQDAAKIKLDDDQERDFLPQVLGSAYDEMIADGVSWLRIQRIGRYCLLYFTLGPEAAAAHVRSSGEAPAPNRETRRAKKGSRQGSSAPDRSPTRRRASTGATKSRPTPKAG